MATAVEDTLSDLRRICVKLLTDVEPGHLHIADENDLSFLTQISPCETAALLRAVSFLFVLKEPDGVFFGGVADGESVSAFHARPEFALLSVVGEIAEQRGLSQLSADADLKAPSNAPAAFAWIEGRPPKGAASASDGCAARFTIEDAAWYGLLELIERDAAAHWWLGGRRARPFSVQTRHADRRGRRTYHLDISIDPRLPVVAAISFRADGGGFASGIAADASPNIAAERAFRELRQIECGQTVLDAKLRMLGEDDLHPKDREDLARLSGIDEANFLTHAMTPSAPIVQPPSRISRDQTFAALSQIGADIRCADLGHFGDMRVARLFSDALASFHSETIAPRLADQMTKNPPAKIYTLGLPLY